MSYILDALRRLERERIPGRDPGPSQLPPRRILVYAIPGAALAAIAFGVYLIVGGRSSTAVSPESTAAHVAPPAATGKIEPAPEDPAIMRSTAASKQGQEPVARVRNLAEQTRVSPAPAKTAGPQLPGTGSSASATPAKAAPASDGVRLLRAMPPDFQRALPELVVNIHVYAPDATERILYINNREYHAGDKVQDDIYVEQIVEDGAVLSFRGQRFKLPRPS